ncbi:hypothetical protein [Streptomyces sp. NPDC005476]|uniref:hypothetical protein n=1 Tax=Streptomyces sp. NPDC005476 TaxID=3156882 RepID=UPI003456DDBB
MRRRMRLWQMDPVGGVPLADGREPEAIQGGPASRQAEITGCERPADSSPGAVGDVEG